MKDFGFRLYFADKTMEFFRSALTPEVDGDACVYRVDVDDCQVLWRHEPIEKGVSVTLTVKSDRPLGIHRIDSVVCKLGVPYCTDRIAFFGSNMNQAEPRFPEELGVGQEYRSDCVCHLEDFTAPGTIVAGVTPYINTFGAGVRTDEDRSITFFAKTEYTNSTAQERELSAERVIFCEDITVDELYDLYQQLLPQSSFPMPKLTGWNTWDYYLDRVRPEDIEENVDALKQLPFAKELRYIVIDDGWQRDWGDWRENDKFSCGLKVIADRILAAGFIPGIWTAPLGVRKTSDTYANHPEWLLQDENGEQFFTDGMCYLDPTIPEAEQFILNNYLYQYKAGFRLFKIDYLSALLRIKNFHDKSATAFSVLRGLMKKIVAYTGEDAVILGCSLPLQSGADIAPTMRIAFDIHNHFSHVKWIAESLAWAWMANNRVTRIDADFMVVRGEETADEALIWEPEKKSFVPGPRAAEDFDAMFQRRWRFGDQFNALEAETWANLVAITGGNIFLSDRMSKLNQRGLDIIQKAMAAAGDRGRPRFLKTDIRHASVWTSQEWILVINWEDIPSVLTVDGIHDCLESDKPFVQEDGCLKVRLRPHESFLAKRK